MLRILLITAALLLLPALARAEVLTPEEASVLAARGKLTIVDIRLPFEWAETGLPAGAEGVSLQNPETFDVRPAFVADILRALGGDKDRPIALICARGNRSAFAQRLLAASGFTTVHDISEGVLGGPNGPGWRDRALPTEPCRVC